MVVEPLISLVDLQIQRIVNTPINSNCFVIHTLHSKECILIDPGSRNNSELMGYLNKHKLIPSKIILTHEHFDHIWGLLEIADHFTFELICNEACANSIFHPKKNLSLFYDQIGFSISREITTVEQLNYQLNWQGITLCFIQTPGHSDGSISIQLDKMLFCGDLMIQNEKTITKLPGGSLSRLNKTLAFLKLKFSPEIIIHSGHGESFVFKKYYLYDKF